VDTSSSSALIVTATVPGGASSGTEVAFNNEINFGILSFSSPTVIWTKHDPDLNNKNLVL
jgi:hypothetical protein